MPNLPSQLEPLNHLKVGESAQVVAIEAPGAARWRLLDLGLVPGTKIEMVRRSPLGDPVLYQLRGTTIALRAADAAEILVSRSAFSPAVLAPSNRRIAE